MDGDRIILLSSKKSKYGRSWIGQQAGFYPIGERPPCSTCSTLRGDRGPDANNVQKCGIISSPGGQRADFLLLDMQKFIDNGKTKDLPLLAEGDMMIVYGKTITWTKTLEMARDIRSPSHRVVRHLLGAEKMSEPVKGQRELAFGDYSAPGQAYILLFSIPRSWPHLVVHQASARLLHHVRPAGDGRKARETARSVCWTTVPRQEHRFYRGHLPEQAFLDRMVQGTAESWPRPESPGTEGIHTQNLLVGRRQRGILHHPDEQDHFTRAQLCLVKNRHRQPDRVLPQVRTRRPTRPSRPSKNRSKCASRSAMKSQVETEPASRTFPACKASATPAPSPP